MLICISVGKLTSDLIFLHAHNSALSTTGAVSRIIVLIVNHTGFSEQFCLYIVPELGLWNTGGLFVL